MLPASWAAAPAQEAEVQRQRVGRPQHVGRGPAAARIDGEERPVTAAHQRRQPCRQGVARHVRRLEVNVDVDGAGRGDQILAMGDQGRRPAHEGGVDAVHRVGIAGLADADDSPLAHADVALHDPDDGVDRERVVDHEVERAVGVAPRRLHPHPVPVALAAARRQLLAGNQPVLGDVGHEAGVAQPHPVARGRAERRRVGGARRLRHVTPPGSRAPGRGRGPGPSPPDRGSTPRSGG